MTEGNESMAIMGHLRGHADSITCLKTSLEDPNMLLSGSRGIFNINSPFAGINLKIPIFTP